MEVLWQYSHIFELAGVVLIIEAVGASTNNGRFPCFAPWTKDQLIVYG
jgi:hypothetical protein